jgi:hypothetical protein
MIALRNDCLLFQLATGESVPCSAEMISVEVVGDSHWLEPDVLRHAAASVFHYFKTELARETVTVGEFSVALEKALRHLGLTICAGEAKNLDAGVIEADLRQFAHEAAGSHELFFYPRLRKELRTQLRLSPRVMRFHGLRGCVKQLAGARRWSGRCEQLQQQIVAYLRQCLTAETEQAKCALVVE